MKTIFAALALAVALSGGVQAATYTSSNGDLPAWAAKAFEKTH